MEQLSCSRSFMTAVLLMLPLSSAEGNLQLLATTECPTTFKLGVNLVKCKIYGDNIACYPPPIKIQIIKTKSGGETIQWDPTYPPTSCNSTPDTIPDGKGECTNKVGNTFTYLYKFVVESKNASFEVKLRCTVPCFGSKVEAVGDPCAVTFAKGPDCEPLDCGKGVSVCEKSKDGGPPKARCNCTGTGLTGTQCDGPDCEPLDCGKCVSVCEKSKDGGPPKARCNCTGTGLTGTLYDSPDCEPLDCGKCVSVCEKSKDGGPPKARCNCTGTWQTGALYDDATKGDNALWVAVGSSVGLGLVLTVVMATVWYLKKTRRTQEEANGDTTNVTNSPAGVGHDSASAKAAQEATATAVPIPAESKNPFSPNEDDNQSDYSENGAEESEASDASEG